MDQVMNAVVDIVESGRATPSDRAGHAAKRMLLDAMGCALGSYREQVPTTVRRVSEQRAKRGGAPIFGSGARVHPDAAVFANSVGIRFLDYNDTYGSTGGVGHPSDYIPAAMAPLGDTALRGPQILAGILVGYEVFCRLTDATQLGVEQIDHVLNGAVAAAAAAVVANQLPSAVTRHALSLALTANLSLQNTRLGELSMWKGCAAGNAARNGVFAAELAAAGITGPEAPFTGRGGLAAVTGHQPDLAPLTRDGRPAIMDCHVKRFPSGYFSQGAVEAALAVQAKLGGAEPAAVRVGTFEFGKRVMAGDDQKWRPTTRETADHSIPYVVACALARGHVGIRDLDESQLAAPDIRRLLDVLTVEVDPECAAAWPEACLNKVTVTLADGRQLSESVRYYRGHAENPMSDQELEAKFGEQAQGVLGEDNAGQLVKAVWALDEADSPDAVFGWEVAG